MTSTVASDRRTVQSTGKTRMKKPDPPLDFSFLNIITPKDLINEEPRGRKERKQDEKYATQCLKLNNNHFHDLVGLLDVVSEIVLQPQAITWIDLSFNNLRAIDPAFREFEQLQILYLHGNSIEDIHEVDKLSELPSLKKLALHGNAMETTKHYRLYVLAHCPQVISFDMNTVTKAERETARVLFKSFSSPPTSRRSAGDDD